MTDIHAFIRDLPKVELHLHIEGSLEPELMFELASRNGVKLPYATVEDIRRAYNFNNLQEFLDIYYQGMSVLQTEADFYDLTMAYLTRVHADNVRHVEIFFDPQGHTERGIAFETVINGITRALSDGERDLGISYKLIMCFLRHLSEEDAFATLAEAEPFLDRIDGVGLDSSEVGHPPSKFKNVFAKCREHGLFITAHAGEEGPPEYVYEALDILDVDRIDHGNRSLEDDALIKRLAESEKVLTVCPLSNLKLCVVDDLKAHPLRLMLNDSLKATVNSDDPSYFGGYMNDNFIAVTDALNLTKEEIARLALNAVEGSLASPERKADMSAELSAYFTANAVKPA